MTWISEEKSFKTDAVAVPSNPIPQNREDLLRSLEVWLARGACDLHMHSTASDGSDSPAELMQLCLESGLSVVALTDHDSVNGIPEATAALKRLDPDGRLLFLPGTELSLDFEGFDVHVLALFPPASDLSGLNAFFAEVQAERTNRNFRMVHKLNELGFPVRYEELFNTQHNSMSTMENSKSSTIRGRVHAAVWLRKHGYCRSVDEAFERYLGEGKPANVERLRPDVQRGITEIRKTGGISVLAHPQQYGWCADEALLRRLLTKLKALGLDAVESFHSEMSPAQAHLVSTLCLELGLPRSQGSDFHGKYKPGRRLYTKESLFI